MRFFLTILLLFLLACCKPENKTASPSGKGQNPNPLFTILTGEETGISFKNEITESVAMNGLFYEYYYNGAGLAVADFNHDGLQDVYFNSNLHPNKLYLNTGKLRFRDVSKESGIAEHAGYPTGVTIVDINSDGWMDLYVSNSGKFDAEMLKNKLFVNQGVNNVGIPVFIEKSAEYGLDIDMCSTQAAFFDFDHDNDLDMFLINHFPDIYNFRDIRKLLKTESAVTGDRLYENRNGKYIDVSKKAGVTGNRLSYCLGLGISDLNNDGWPDVYVSNDYSGRDFLYINNKNGTFTECLNQSLKHISFSSMGNDLADFNNDGWSDIVTLDMMAGENYGKKASYSSMNQESLQTLVDMGMNYQYMYNTLQMNTGLLINSRVPVFSDIAQMAGVSSTDWSWGPLVFDMDNDGLKDLFVANGIKRDFINNDYLAFFEKKYQELIVPGKLDRNEFITSVLSRMPNRKKSDCFFRNTGNLTFEKKNGDWVQDKPTCSNGSAYADFDNDGDLDIIINNSEEPSFIYRNNAREQGLGNYLQFRLSGPEKNPFGIGTKIMIVQKGQIQVLEQYLTRGYLSSVSMILHAGLGPDDSIPEIRVIWPDGKEQLVRNIAANQVLDLAYKNASQMHEFTPARPSLFGDVTQSMRMNHRHVESNYNDFQRESLLLYKMSVTGPALAVGDVNHDDMEDFYIGGAKGQPGRLYLQIASGFVAADNQPWSADSPCEDVGAEFFDADGDGDPDLYVVSGSNEYEEGSPYLQDRLYVNIGSGSFRKTTGALPDMSFSGSCVAAGDYDLDGDMDLLVGGRQKPGKYPLPVSSRLLRNDSERNSITFTDITTEAAQPLNNLGMVTGAVFTDINGDTKPDLVVVGEWMSPRILINADGTFRDITEQSGLQQETGWWNCIAAADPDRDGDIDLVAGNLGLNSRFRAEKNFPFELYVKDYDNNGSLDLVFGYFDQGTLYPLHGLKRSSMQLPYIRQRFPTFDAFARATLEDVYGNDNLSSALHYQAANFATTYFENQGNGTFQSHPLEMPAQVSCVNGIVIEDVDRDGNLDLILAGNNFGTEIETSRADAGIGLYLKGNGAGLFEPIPADKTGLLVDGDVRHIRLIRLGKDKNRGILVARNNSLVQIVRIY